MNQLSFKNWLQTLEQDGVLKHIEKPVDKEFQIAALGKQADGKYALVFDHVSGAQMPVVSSIVSTRTLFAKAMGVKPEEVSERFIWAQKNPRKCVLIGNSEAPVKEYVSKEVDLSSFPIPTHHEKDGGSYITAGVLIAKNPRTGEKNVSIHRLQVLSPNRLGILILPRHLDYFHRQAESDRVGLDVAIAIGVDPLTLLASQALVPLGFDELTIASALHKEPLELVRGETVDLEYPANAEIVFEGKLLPEVREAEGPFGEYPRYYGPESPKPVIELSCVCRRSQAMFHTIVPATMEHFLLGGIPREAGLFELIKNVVPTVKAVHLTEGGSCRYHAVISIDKKNEGEGKNAIMAAFSSSAEIKHVVCVDSDVDIFNMTDVEWAIATRVQASRDVFIIRDAMGNALDPSSHHGVSDKMGIDATVPLGALCFEKNAPGRFERIKIPYQSDMRLDDYIVKGG